MNMHMHERENAFAWVKVSGVGEALPLADSSVDAVVCTLTLCSVRDPAATVAEVRRVLRAGGLFLTLTLTPTPTPTLTPTLTLTLTRRRRLVLGGSHGKALAARSRAG